MSKIYDWYPGFKKLFLKVGHIVGNSRQEKEKKELCTISLIESYYMPGFISDKYEYFTEKLEEYICIVSINLVGSESENKCYFIFDTGNEKNIYFINLNIEKIRESYYNSVPDNIIFYITKTNSINCIYERILDRDRLQQLNQCNLDEICDYLRQGKIYTAYNKLTGTELTGSTGSQKLPKNLDRLFKYKSMNTEVDFSIFLQLISEQKIYVPHPAKFNDIFDTVININWLKGISDDFKKLQLKYKEIEPEPTNSHLPETVDKFLTNINESQRILSLSAIDPLKSEANAQWAHYSQEYSGYAVEYNVEELFYILSLQKNKDCRGSEISMPEFYSGFIHFREVEYKGNFNPYDNLLELYSVEGRSGDTDIINTVSFFRLNQTYGNMNKNIDLSLRIVLFIGEILVFIVKFN